MYETTPFDKEDKRAVWNEALLGDAVAHAYCILLEDLTTICSNSDSYAVWPTHWVSGFWQCLTRTLYNYICSDDGLSVFKADSCWVPLRKCIILDQDFRKEEISKIALAALTTLVCISRIDIKVIDIPDIIIKTILQTCWKEIHNQKIC